MSLRFAGVRRKTEFSPNHISNDLQIITLTGEALQELGHSVDWFNEEETRFDCRAYDLVFSMAQGPTGNRMLAETCLGGGVIINSPMSVVNCYRTNLVHALVWQGIPFPRSEVLAVDTNGRIAPVFLGSPKVWVKRGDVHAVHKEDVTLVYSEEEQLSVLREFGRRGIQHAIIQEHLDGDTVKFYAIRDAEFFYWYYMNGVLHTPFSQERLIDLARASAEALDLYVFGGDAIIAPDGSISIIDINDWPSFAPVRSDASRQIAQLLIRKAKEHVDELCA